jgi:multicomponent Na+:H+ antiporter subunit E
MKASHCFIFNLFLGILWIILNGEADIFQFLFGFGIGFAILWTFQHVLNAETYVRRAGGFIRFLCVFIYLFVISNINVARVILFYYKTDISPSYISYSIEDLSKVESILISQFITLTPGSVSVRLGRGELIVHLLNVRDEKKAIANIDRLKRLVIGFTR